MKHSLQMDETMTVQDAPDLAPALDYLDATEAMVRRIRETQLDPIAAAARMCADSIAQGGLVHLFGSGHSRIPVFHPIVELSLTHHTQVVGANGQRQAMFLERIEGFGEVILRNFVFGPHDCFMVFSNGGVNEVVIDVAMGAKRRGMPVIAVVSRAHSDASTPRHSSGKRLTDLADIVLDNCSPVGDAMVTVPDLQYPVAPGSTVGYAIVVNMLKALVAADLARRGQPPLVLTSGAIIGGAASAALFDRTYDDYRARIARVYGWDSAGTPTT
jgi:uncharacterized phosphosugar-binding protein